MWCEIHKRDFSGDTGLFNEPLGCCALCILDSMYAEEDELYGPPCDDYCFDAE